MDRSIRVGALFGIPINLHYSWFLIFGVVLFTLATIYFPTYNSGWSEQHYWIVGALTTGLFFASVLIHELAHSVLAISEGVEVKDITMFIFGGVSNIKKEADNPGVEFRIAAAGPAASIILAVVFVGLWLVGVHLDESLAAMSLYLAMINGLLAVFNLIPGFPLDGGRVLRSVLWKLTDNYRLATRIASWAGQILAYSFVLVGLLLLVGGNWLNGVWLLLIGWFLASAAGSSYQQAMVNQALKGISVGDMMSKDCPSVDEQTLLSDFMQDYVLRHNLSAFPVLHGAALVGMVTVENLKSVPQERWIETRVSQVMTTIEKLKTLQPWDEAIQALQQFAERSDSQVPVVDGGRVVGLLSRTRVLQFIKVREDEAIRR
ncbi:MAG: site-2 protease family protein [Chloroflexi bacterium]|nr:site-2 protease family protein [Chloroflexota bacterium]